jgi:hypothetical protein
MTLFDAVSSDPKFATAISKFYGGKPDPGMLDLLAASTNGSPVSQTYPQRVVPPGSIDASDGPVLGPQAHKYEVTESGY